MNFSELNNTIIICHNFLKRFFIQKRTNKPDINFDLFTKDELQKKVFGDYKDNTYKFLIHNTNLSINKIDKYLKYIQRGINVSINKQINDLFNFLIKEGLIYKEPYIKQLFKNKKIYIFGYLNDNIELKHLLDELECNNIEYKSIDDLLEKVNSNIFCFNTKDEEIRYVFNKIIDSYDESIKNKIICNTSEYKFFLDLYSEKYGLKLYYENSNNFLNTDLAKEFLSLILNNQSTDSFFEQTNEEINTIKSIINKYELNCKSDEYEIFKFFFSNIKQNQVRYNNETIISSSIDFNPIYDYYVLGASDDFLPNIIKNNDLIDDMDKEKNNLCTSIDISKENEMLSIAFLNQKNIKHVSYYIIKGKNEVYPTSIIKNCSQNIEIDYDYSKDISKAYYSKAKEIKDRYNEVTKDLCFDFKLDVYDNKYKTIELINNNDISFSYSSLNKLYECPFSYYCNKILKIDDFSDTYYTKRGTYAHKIFENVYKVEKFEEAFLLAKNEYDLFNTKEKRLINGFNEDIKKVYEIIRNRDLTQIVNAEYEVNNKIQIDTNLYVEGRIDCIIEVKNDEIVIYDFKTGSFNLGNNELFKEGLCLQLLFYAYLLSNNNKYKNKKIIGMFYQPLLAKDNNFWSEKYSKEFNISGINFKNDVSGYLSIIMPQINKEKFDTNDLDEYNKLIYEKIKEAEKICRENRFDIKPVVKTKVNTEVDPCAYCKFRDVCYVKDVDEQKNIIEEDK